MQILLSSDTTVMLQWRRLLNDNYIDGGGGTVGGRSPGCFFWVLRKRTFWQARPTL